MCILVAVVESYSWHCHGHWASDIAGCISSNDFHYLFPFDAETLSTRNHIEKLTIVADLILLWLSTIRNSFDMYSMSPDKIVKGRTVSHWDKFVLSLQWVISNNIYVIHLNITTDASDMQIQFDFYVLLRLHSIRLLNIFYLFIFSFV